MQYFFDNGLMKRNHSGELYHNYVTKQRFHYFSELFRKLKISYLQMIKIQKNNLRQCYRSMMQLTMTCEDAAKQTWLWQKEKNSDRV